MLGRKIYADDRRQSALPIRRKAQANNLARREILYGFNPPIKIPNPNLAQHGLVHHRRLQANEPKAQQNSDCRHP
ncbi:hypothetical protein GCM10022269_22190 [Sphingorhabdus rigui]